MLCERHRTYIARKVCVWTAGASPFASHIKVGVTVGSRNKGKNSSKKGSISSLHYCTGKREQLLHHLYVDYFQSSGPCLTPDGAKLFPFRSDQYEYADGGSAMCDRLPRVCQLLARPRGRSILQVGQKMLETLGNNVRSLYNVLTGRATSSSPASSTPTPTDPRLFKPSLPQAAIVYPDDCDYGECGEGYGVRVCESVDDVVFPMLGVSALTNTTVNIIQTFPDLLQPVFFRRCRSRQAQVVYGECVQEYLPVSLLVSPDHPGAVLAQDFVLVESGCHVAAHLTHYHAKTIPAEPIYNTIKDVQDPGTQLKDARTQLENMEDSGMPDKNLQETTQLRNPQESTGQAVEVHDSQWIPSRVRESDRRLF